MTLSEFKDDYQRQMKLLISQKETEFANFQKSHREDEAKFARIELNIIDIFEKMFTASLNKVKDLEHEPSTIWLETLKLAYLNCFDKIPMAWHQNLEKCQRFDSQEEAHIESVKIAMANGIKEMFLLTLTRAKEEMS